MCNENVTITAFLYPIDQKKVMLIQKIAKAYSDQYSPACLIVVLPIAQIKTSNYLYFLIQMGL